MPSTLRVALLATVVDFGGIERVLLNLLEHMDPGIRLFPILFTRIETRGSYFMKRVDNLEIPYAVIYVDTSRYKYWNPIRNIGDAIRCFRGEKFDLIHTHGYRADLIGLVISKCRNLPIVSTCHGLTPSDKKAGLYIKLDLFLLNFFDRIIAVSDQIKRDLAERGVDETKIALITNAVSDNAGSDRGLMRKETRLRLGIREGEFVFGYVGRLSQEKGVDYLMEAVKQGLAEGNPWRLVVVGDGPRRALLEQIVQDAGLSNRVLFAGFQNETTPWYSAMDAFVLPSLTEGTPMALLEAMAHGVPAVATSVGGVPAVLRNEENGLLVPSANPVRLLEAMRSIAGNHQLRARMSIGGTHTIRSDHDVTKWAKKVVEVYMTIGQQMRRKVKCP